MDLITISEAARLLGVSLYALRHSESPDGLWTYIRGGRLRVYRTGPLADSRRLYRRQEVLALADVAQSDR